MFCFLLFILFLFISRILSFYWISSVAQSCLTLCDPMACSMPGFPVHHLFPELPQTHVCRWYLPNISSSVVPSPLAFNLSQHQGLFQLVGRSHQVASVLPMNIQSLFPLGLTGLISLLSKDSQESSSAPRGLVKMQVLGPLPGISRLFRLLTDLMCY